MNLFDFYTGAYGLFTALFATIFGMSFPLILQCVQRIDEKYDSSVISQIFEQETSYKLFQWLLFPYIVLVCASPLILGKLCSNVGLSYAFQCFMISYVLLIAVVMVCLFKRMTVYYSVGKLVDSFNSTPKRNVLLCFDLAKYASKKGYQDVYIEAMVKVAECFIIEREQVKKDLPVEYSDSLNRILLEIGRLLKAKDYDLEYKFSDIMSIILDHSDRHYISDKTYRYIWFMLNNAISSGNNQWFKDYWTWAVQYYEFKSNQVTEGKHNPEMKNFLLFNVMLGAVLSFYERYECLSHIMKYSNATNRYPLIPGNFGEIVDIARQIDSMLDKPMEFAARFPIAGLDNGVNTDNAIFSQAINYLALLFIRMWSYQDYNIGHCEPLSVPSPSDISIDENETYMRLMGLIRKRVETIYDSNIIENLHLAIIPKSQKVTELIDKFIHSCDAKNAVINLRPGYDKEKLKHIYDEFVISNSSSTFSFPSKEMIGTRDNAKTIEIDVEASQKVERRFLQVGRTIECGGIGRGLSLYLDLKIRQAFIDKVKDEYDVIEENVNRSSLLNRLNELLKDGPKAIIDLSSGIEFPKEATVYHLGRIWVKDAIFVCDTSCVPTLDIVKRNSELDTVGIIDGFNYLYGSIREEFDLYEVSVMQTISIEVLQGKSKGWLIYIK